METVHFDYIVMLYERSLFQHTPLSDLTMLLIVYHAL